MGKNNISLHFSESWKLSIISYVYGPYIFLCEIPINVFCSILYWLCLFIIIFIVLLKILNVFFIRNLYLLYVVNVVSPIIVYLFTSFKYKQKMSLPPKKKMWHILSANRIHSFCANCCSGARDIARNTTDQDLFCVWSWLSGRLILASTNQ